MAIRAASAGLARIQVPLTPVSRRLVGHFDTVTQKTPILVTGLPGLGGRADPPRLRHGEPGPEMEWDERGQRPVGPPDPDEVAAYEECLEDPPSRGDAVALAIVDFPGDVLFLGLVIGGFCAVGWISACDEDPCRILNVSLGGCKKMVW